MNYKVVVDEDTVPSFKVGDRVKFKKSSIDSGMIDATEDDVFVVEQAIDESILILQGDYYMWYFMKHFEHVKEEIMEEQEINWEVGQEVFCLLRGKGIVHEIHNNGCPWSDGVYIHFESHGNLSYKFNGSIGEGFNRSLFFSEPVVTAELFPPKKPFVPTLKKGDMVVVNTHLGSICHKVNEETETHLDCNGQRYAKQKITSLYKLGEEIKFG